MKTKWRRLKETEASLFWDCYLERFDKANPCQSYAWGQFYKALGWEPLYLVCEDSNLNILSMFLGHFQVGALGLGIVTSAGGPIGDLAKWGKDLREFVRVSVGKKHFYFRVRCDRSDSGNDIELLRAQDWTVPKITKTSGQTMELDIDRSDSLLYSGLSKHWKKNLRSARNKELSVRVDHNPNAAEIRSLFSEFESQKNLPELFSEEEFQKLFDSLGSNLLVLRCENKKGKLLSVRLVLRSSAYALDYLAATNIEGRKLRASYYLLWETIVHCRETGIHTYDLGGIDPVLNEGVYYFKKGTGAKHIQQIGELDWATDKFVEIIANTAITILEVWKKSRIRKRIAPDSRRLRLSVYNDGPPLRKSSVN